MQDNDNTCNSIQINEDCEILTNPKQLWGQFIYHLRKNNLMTLHTACGEIRDIKLENYVLKAFVKDKYLFNILTSSEINSKIALELKSINDKISIEFILKEKANSKIESNLLKIKELFGDEINIIY